MGCLHYILAHDSLDALKQIEKLRSVAAKLEAVLKAVPVPKETLFQLEVALQVVVHWIEDIPMGTHTASTLTAVSNFGETMMFWIDRLPMTDTVATFPQYVCSCDFRILVLINLIWRVVLGID